MPPKKVRKHCASQKSVKDVAQAASASCPFDSMLPDHLHRHILSFLLAKPVPVQSPRNWEEKDRPYDAVRGDHGNLSLVCKQWKSVVEEIVNEGAPREILTPRELAELKSKVFALDLSADNKAIHKMFESLIKMKWPKKLRVLDDGEPVETDPLDEVMRGFFGGQNAFIAMVEEEYKRFLVHKCVEYLACNKKVGEAISSTSMWTAPVVPCELVDLFWQAHVVRTIKYVKVCHSLVGDIIEYQQSYHDGDEGDARKETSSLSNGHKRLFRFEQYFLKHNLFCEGCRVPIDEIDSRDFYPKNRLAAREWFFAPSLKFDELEEKI